MKLDSVFFDRANRGYAIESRMCIYIMAVIRSFDNDPEVGSNVDWRGQDDLKEV